MRSTHDDSDVTRLQSMPGTLKSDWDLTSTDAKTPKIELELIMSDVAIRYLGALIFLVNLKYFMVTGDKVAQLVRCRTSNQRVACSIPGHSRHFGRSWAKQFIPYCFSLPSCKMGT